MKIKCSLTENSIDDAIKQLKAYQKDLERKCKEICKRLADVGLQRATIDYQNVAYVGSKDVSIGVMETESGYVLTAYGSVVLILEFGAGKTFGYGHPQADDFGMGPGTHPDPHYRTVNGQLVANWENPKGWYVPGMHNVRTLGNAPSMAMYHAKQDMRGEIERIAREVFAND